MAIKIVGVICGVSWAIFGISFLFQGPTGQLEPPGVVLFGAGMMIGIITLVALAIMALINYARRPR